MTKSTNQRSYDDDSSSPEDQDASPQRPQPQVQTPSKQQPSAPPLTQSVDEQQLNEERQRFQSHLQLQLNQISAVSPNMHQQQQQVQYQQSPMAVTPDGGGGGGGGAANGMEAHNRIYNNRINLIDSEYDSVSFFVSGEFKSQ